MDPPLHGETDDHYDDHMVREVTATEARARLLALLDDIETFDEIVITGRGRLVARIVVSTVDGW